MNVVDSSGWLEYFADGPNAPFFADAVEATGELIVPTISLYEVFKRCPVSYTHLDVYKRQPMPHTSTLVWSTASATSGAASILACTSCSGDMM